LIGKWSRVHGTEESRGQAHGGLSLGVEGTSENFRKTEIVNFQRTISLLIARNGKR